MFAGIPAKHMCSLAPRQRLARVPFASHSVFAGQCFCGVKLDKPRGVAANQYVLTGDARLSDARNPLTWQH